MNNRPLAGTSVFGILLSLFLQLACPAIFASPTDLEDWHPWVLDKHPDSGCPWQMSRKEQRLCSWPGNLRLDLSAKGLAFILKVDVYSDQELIQIPGEEKYWPDSVSLNGTPAPLVEKNSVPHVSLPKGHHELKGFIGWKQQPNALTIPSSIAFITLYELGRELAIDRRGEQVIFSQKETDTRKRERDSLAVEVYRLLSEGVPLMLETRIKLVVSGKPREIKIGRVALDGTEVTGLSSRLPARIEADGDLRIQVTAGEHHVRVFSRFLTNIELLETERRGELWPAIEYISFVSSTDIRQTKLSGAVSVDTSQIAIPREWKGLPTYRMQDDTRLLIETVHRGDHSPLANQLNVRRELWLDFKGEAITSLDTVTGRMYRHWRLNARADTNIGRATVEGQPVLVTQDRSSQEKGLQGIEIRSPNINLSAVTRISNPGHFSASGWDARVDQFQSTLHLPPGWRVLHASGVDNIYGTWVRKWDLWDIFLILIMIAASNRLLGLKPAILATGALIISYHEPGAPVLFFPLLLLILALLTVVSGRWKQVISIAGTALSAILILATISFAVSSFRMAIYPSLEKSRLDRYQEGLLALQLNDSPVFFGSPISSRKPATEALQGQLQLEKFQDKLKRGTSMEEIVVTASRVRDDMYQVDENDRVQTGPGLPTWLWNRVTLRASSPVLADQNLSIIYCPPWITGIWRIVSVFLLGAFAALLIIRLARTASFRKDNAATTSGLVESLLIFLIPMVLLAPQIARAEEFPPKYLLSELESRLLKAPDCLPTCASISSGLVIAEQSNLRLSFDVYVDADIALPVPTSREGWRIDAMTIDGIQDAPATIINNQSFILAKKGHHKIVLSGKIQGDQASISFPLPIHNISVQSDDWFVEGLVDDRIPSKTLSLRSKAKTQRADADTLIADPVLPFVIVHREFSLGIRWTMTTSVKRTAPKEGPIAVSIPLLPFEKVLSDTLNIQAGKVQLQFSHRQQEIIWRSSLSPMETMELTAADDPGYMETWRITPSSLWRISYSGIPPTKEAGDLSSLRPYWKPWPEEKLTIKISRPEGVPGPTHTAEEVVLRYKAGKRIQTSHLSVYIRSSLGEDYTVTLPDNAEVLSLMLDGAALNLPSGNSVTVPLQPRVQKLEIGFQQHQNLNMISTTPTIGLPGGATNITISYELPRDRWPLFITGPAIGPAMLFWGVLCVIVLGAIVLNMTAQKLALDMPVRLRDWLLLGIGLSTVNSYGVLIIAIFFFALAGRKRHIDPPAMARTTFNGIQIIILLWTVITVWTLLAAIPMGLLSDPDMRVVGNGSHSHLFNFYQDRAAAASFPSAYVFSVSIFSYRVVMLAWSLWLATRLIHWSQWWWKSYSAKGVWVSGS